LIALDYRAGHVLEDVGRLSSPAKARRDAWRPARAAAAALLRRIRIEGKDAASEIAEQSAEPTFECPHLLDVTPMPNELDPAPELADRRGSDMERRIA
jgi:hypothetical protein